MSNSQITYEYRVWDENVRVSHDDLVSLFGPPRRETRTDFYWPPKEPYLPKFRARDRLELKERLAKEDGLDIWKRAISAEFPISERELELFGVCSPDLDFNFREFSNFKTAMAYLKNKVPLLPIIKQRALYQTSKSEAEKSEIELSDISVLGETHTTLAIECSSKGAALDLASQLNLFEFDNMSYLDWLIGHKITAFNKSD